MTEIAARQVHAAIPRSRGGKEVSSTRVASLASDDETGTGVPEISIAFFSIVGFAPASVDDILLKLKVAASK